MSDVSVRAALAVMLGALALSASGIGRVTLGNCAPTPTRVVTAHYLVGLLAYSLVFALATHARLAFGAVVVLLLGFGFAGVIGVLAPANGIRHMVRRLAVAGGIAASLFFASAMPSNDGAMDPTTYAYMTTLFFQHGWATENLVQLSDYAWLRDTSEEGVLGRAASLALLWPAAAVGWGVSARLVAGAAAWFLLPAFAALVDILHGRASLPVRVVLAAGAVGVFNEVAALAGGQINQTFALAVILGAVWAFRWIDNPFKQRLVLGLAGATISAGYPEFLAAVPLYLVCCALVARRSLHEVVLDGSALGAGWALVQVSTRLRNLSYLLDQVDVGPGWWPLADQPASVADVWRHVLVQRLPPPLLLLILVPIAWYAWRRTQIERHVDSPCPCLGLLSIAALVVLGGIWSWLTLHGANPNYATFKLGGWLGPGLFLCGFLLAARGPQLLRRTSAVLLILLATSRLMGLAVDTRQNIIAYESSPQIGPAWRFAESISPGHDNCLIQVASDERTRVMAAISETAAPSRGCQLVVGLARLGFGTSE